MSETNYLENKKASEEMAKKIAAVWERRGKDVRVWVETEMILCKDGRRRPHYYIRSDIGSLRGAIHVSSISGLKASDTSSDTAATDISAQSPRPLSGDPR